MSVKRSHSTVRKASTPTVMPSACPDGNAVDAAWVRAVSSQAQWTTNPTHNMT
jgi:hypothetical protein